MLRVMETRYERALDLMQARAVKGSSFTDRTNFVLMESPAIRDAFA